MLPWMLGKWAPTLLATSGDPAKGRFRGFPKLGVPFGGPNNKDHNILGSILGSPYFGKLPFRALPPQKKKTDMETPRKCPLEATVCCREAIHGVSR